MSAGSVPYQPKPHQWSQGDRESDGGCGGGGSTFKLKQIIQDLSSSNFQQSNQILNNLFHETLVACILLLLEPGRKTG